MFERLFMSPDLIATVLIFASAISHAISSSMYRVVGDRMVRMVVGSGLALIIMIPLATIVPFPSLEAWFYILPSATIIVIYQFLVAKSLQYGQLSYIYPVSRGTAPVFVVLLTLLFLSHEMVLIEIVGVLLVAIGIIELALRGFDSSDGASNLKKATSFALFTGLFTAIYTLIDADGIRLVENPFSYIAWLFIIINVAFVSIVGLRRGRIFFSKVYEERKSGLIAGLFGIASYVLALMALRLGSAVEIAALRETSIMFAIIIGYFFLGEGIGVRRVVAVTLISIGAVTIKAF